MYAVDLAMEGEPWTEVETSLLNLEFRAGIPALSIAAAHFRSISETIDKLDKMQLVHFRGNAYRNSRTGAVWLPMAEKRERQAAEHVVRTARKS